MRLINPQPMDTLPESGDVFVRYTSDASREDYTCEWEVRSIRRHRDRGMYIYTAWSYTATTEPDEQTTNTPTP